MLAAMSPKSVARFVVLLALFAAAPAAAHAGVETLEDPAKYAEELQGYVPGASALEGSLRTTALNGTTDSPVTNIRMVVKNSSTVSYALVSGLVTFYDSSGVRCGEGLFKANALAVGEAFETDTPGIRIRCSPSTWRIIATNLLPRVAPLVENPAAVSRATTNLLISIDGEEHPLQIDRPLVLTLGNAQRTIVVRPAP